MIEVRVERGQLDKGAPMIYADLGPRVRMMYDPHQVTETEALAHLIHFVPRLTAGVRISREPAVA